jgi:hypothetical protein
MLPFTGNPQTQKGRSRRGRSTAWRVVALLPFLALLALAAATAFVFGIVGERGGNVQAAGITVTATATGSLSPPTASFPNTVTNGDFLIWSGAGIIGDGIDEQTSWTFDFTTDPNFASFPASAPLASALLTLTLTPKAVDINTDIVRIEGFSDVVTAAIQGLPVGVTNTVELELLDFYSSNDILGVFTAGAGQIPMGYGDDAIVSFAQLDLESAGAVGGVVELVGSGWDAPAHAAEGSGSSSPPYAAIAGAAAAAVGALAAGGWLARRRWAR